MNRDLAEDLDHTAQELLGEGNVKEFVRSMSIRLRAQNTSNNELSIRVLFHIINTVLKNILTLVPRKLMNGIEPPSP